MLKFRSGENCCAPPDSIATSASGTITLAYNPTVSGLTFNALSELGFLARGDMQTGHREGYVLSIDPDSSNSHFKLTKLTAEQSSYLNVPAQGPFKPEQYRY